MRTTRRVLAVLLVLIILTMLVPTTIFAAPGDPELYMSVANKIDVALAIGKTNVNYLTFEADLRAALKWAPRADGLGPDSGGGSILMGNGSTVVIPDSDAVANWRPNEWNGNSGENARPVPDEDLYILAAETVDTNVSKTFNWWVYDHTRNASLFSAAGQKVEPITDDENRIYVPNSGDTSSYTTSSYGNGAVQDTNPAGYATAGGINYSTYTPPVSMYEPYILYKDNANNNTLNPYSDKDGNSVPKILNPGDAGYNGPYTNNTVVRNDTSLLRNPNAASSATVHAYQGNYRHMISSNGGAQMDFYGYGLNGYKDFRYLPNNDNSTIKTFEFAIAEDMAFDALDGVGFFFNTTVTDAPYANQTMSGYLLFFRYASGIGSLMVLYKFKDLNVKLFHETRGTVNTTDQLSELSTDFLQVATAPYPSADYSRHIKVEAAPDTLTVYYVGSQWKASGLTPRPSQTPANTAEADSVLATPLNVKDAAGNIDPSLGTVVNPLKWTITGTNGSPDPLNGNTNQTGANHEYICLDITQTDSTPNYVRSYGYGPMVSYLYHGCGRPTHVTLSRLSMTTVKIKPLADVVKMPQWHENTMKYLVNLNESIIEDFDKNNNAAAAALLSSLTNDDIYYLGWGKTVNAAASADFLNKNDLKGIVVDMDLLSKLDDDPEWQKLDSSTKLKYLEYIVEAQSNNPIEAYWKQIYALADEIYARYYNVGAMTKALTTDQISVGLNDPALMTNTADPSYPLGQWMITHQSPDEANIKILEPGTYTRPDPNNPGQTISVEITNPINMINSTGDYTKDGQFLEDLGTSYTFSNPGHYEILYRSTSNSPPNGNTLGEVDIHRAPIASFSIIRNSSDPTQPQIISTSYDPDVYDLIGTLNEGYNGIAKEEWTWLDMDGDGNTHEVDSLNPFPTLIEGHTYVIKLTVTDDWGATTSYSENLRYSASLLTITPPIPRFTLTPSQILKGSANQTITITDLSTDPQGLKYTYEWSILKNDQPFATIIVPNNAFEYDATGSDRIKSFNLSSFNLDPGTYTVQLKTKNHFWVDSSDDPVPEGTFGAIDKGLYSNGSWSVSFKIIFDQTAPRATISPINKHDGGIPIPDPIPVGYEDFKGNGSVTLTFVEVKGSSSIEYPLDHMAPDEQMSGFARARVAVTSSSTFPSSVNNGNATDNTAWKGYDTVSTRKVAISDMGVNYVHWEAWDLAGNYSKGTFGPYIVVKSLISLTLTAEEASTNPDEIIFGDSAHNKIKLTAALDESDFIEDLENPGNYFIPTGFVNFLQWDDSIGDWVLLGSTNTINSDGTAVWTGAVKTPSSRFLARYLGDNLYGSAEDDDTKNVTSIYTTVWLVGKVDNTSGSQLYRVPKQVIKNDSLYQVIKIVDANSLLPQYSLISTVPYGPGVSDAGLFAPSGGETVEFYYSSNASTVTINMKLYDGVLNSTDILTPVKVPATLGQPFSYTSPSIPGYILVNSSGASVPPYIEPISTVASTSNITFYYVAVPEPGPSEYLLTVIFLDKDTNLELGRAYETSPAAPLTYTAPAITNYDSPLAPDNEFYWDGADNETVTFEYTREKATLKLYAIDSTTDDPITISPHTESGLRVLENYNYSSLIDILSADVTIVDSAYMLLSSSNTVTYIIPEPGTNSVRVYYTKASTPPAGMIPVEVRVVRIGATYDESNSATYELKQTYQVPEGNDGTVTMTALDAPSFASLIFSAKDSVLTAGASTASDKIIFVFEHKNHTVNVTAFLDTLGEPVDSSDPSLTPGFEQIGPTPFTSYTVADGDSVIVYVPGTGYEVIYYLYTDKDGLIGLPQNISGEQSITIGSVTGDINLVFVYKSIEEAKQEEPKTITITGVTNSAQRLYSITYEVSFPYVLNTISALDFATAAVPTEYGGYTLDAIQTPSLPYSIWNEGNYEYTFTYTATPTPEPIKDAPVTVKVYDVDTNEILLEYSIPAKEGATISVDPLWVETLFTDYTYQAGHIGEVLSVVAGDGNDIILYLSSDYVPITVYMYEYAGGITNTNVFTPIEILGKKVGESVSYTAPVIPGYQLVNTIGAPELVTTTTITVSKTTNSIIFYYELTVEVTNPAEELLVDIEYRDIDAPHDLLGIGKILISMLEDISTPGYGSAVIVPAPLNIGDYIRDGSEISVMWGISEISLVIDDINLEVIPGNTIVYFYTRPKPTASLTLMAYDFNTGLPIEDASIAIELTLADLEALKAYIYTGDLGALTALVKALNEKYVPVTQGGSIFLQIDGNSVKVFYAIDNTPEPVVWNVTFLEGLHGSMLPLSVSFTVGDGESISKELVPTITPDNDYVFDGWLCSSDNKVYTVEDLIKLFITEETTFTAQYSFVSGSYWQVVFNEGLHGSMNPLGLTLSVKNGDSIPLGIIPTITSYEGYTFNGWFNSSDGKMYSTTEVARLVILRDTTFTAQYVEIIVEEPSPTPPPSVPKTGDNSNLALWKKMYAISLFGILCIFLMRRWQLKREMR